jgi:hypothetical protein
MNNKLKILEIFYKYPVVLVRFLQRPIQLRPLFLSEDGNRTSLRNFVVSAENIDNG